MAKIIAYHHENLLQKEQQQHSAASDKYSTLEHNSNMNITQKA